LSVTTEQVSLAARATARHRAIQQRADRLRAALPGLAAMLAALGARRVVLFGSLAEGALHDRSDIDLAVEGLPAARYWEALATLAAAAPAPVDLVRVEDAPDSLLGVIARGHEVSIG